MSNQSFQTNIVHLQTHIVKQREIKHTLRKIFWMAQFHTDLVLHLQTAPYIQIPQNQNVHDLLNTL